MNGILLRPVVSHEDAVQAEDLQRATSARTELDIVPSHLILTLAHNGGVVLGGFDKGQMVGLLIDFLASDEETPERVVMARLKHWSHLLAVHPDHADRDLGFALRCAQRDLVIRQGVRLISWAEDPLDARLAFLSIRRLGAISRKYLREAGLSSGASPEPEAPADRLLMDWWITTRRVAARVEGIRKPLNLVHFLEAGARVANPATLREDRLPVPPQDVVLPDANLVLIEVPPDLDALRAREPNLCRQWGLHTRGIFESLFHVGYLVMDFVLLSEERIPRAFYLLSRGDATLG